MTSKVSIIVPCYNQESFLQDTLKSVFDQTYQNWECLIIDDGSTDNSATIANRWVSTDSRFKLLQKMNGGLSSARNHGLKYAKGEYIQFLDGDDILYKDKIKNSLEVDSIHDIIITSFDHLKNKKIYPPFCILKKEYFNYRSILLQWDDSFSIPIHCGLFASKLLEGILFDENVKAGEDWLFWVALYAKNPSTGFLNETLVCYRLHEKSMTQDYSHMIANKQLAHLKIFNELTAENKLLFFERFSREALINRTELMSIHRENQTRKEKKVSRRIKRFFRELLK